MIAERILTDCLWLQVIYDHSAMRMYVATARPDGGAGPLPAYQRQFTSLDMTALFAEPPPTMTM